MPLRPTYLWQILILNQESMSNPQGSKQDLHFARFPQLPLKLFPAGSFMLNQHPNPTQDLRQHFSLPKAFRAPSNALTWPFKNDSPKGSYFLVSESVFLLKKLDHMLLCHMPSPHMWLHPSCSGQLAEVTLHICLSWGLSVLRSPQCHRDGGCRAWTVMDNQGQKPRLRPQWGPIQGGGKSTARGKWTAWGSSTWEGAEFCLLWNWHRLWMWVCLHYLTRLCQHLFLGGELRICWHKTPCYIVSDQGAILGQRMWEWAMTMGPTGYHMPLHLERWAKQGVVLQAPRKPQPGPHPPGGSAALQDTIYALNQELIYSAVSSTVGVYRLRKWEWNSQWPRVPPIHHQITDISYSTWSRYSFSLPLLHPKMCCSSILELGEWCVCSFNHLNRKSGNCWSLLPSTPINSVSHRYYRITSLSIHRGSAWVYSDSSFLDYILQHPHPWTSLLPEWTFPNICQKHLSETQTRSYHGPA